MNYIVIVHINGDLWARYGVFSKAVADEIAGRLRTAAATSGTVEYVTTRVEVVGLDGFDDDSLAGFVAELEAA